MTNRTRWLPFSLALVVLGGCRGSSPSTIEDCRSLAESGARDTCFAEIAVAVYRASPQEGEALLQEIQSTNVRDYVLHTFTREIDPSTARWCQQIQGREMQSRCRLFVQRPHLHRELVGGEGGRPPPGTRGPGGDLPPGSSGDAPPLGVRQDSSDHGRPPPPPPQGP